MSRAERFSRRHGLAKKHEGPLIYDDAPEEVRTGFVSLLRKEFGLSIDTILDEVCDVLRKRPQGNWSHDWIQAELDRHLYRSEWHQFFDIVEAFASCTHIPAGDRYENEVNELFEEEGIGWVLVGNELEMRGEEPLEKVLEDAFDTVRVGDFEVATQELSEAWEDLSRRPEPDLSGAVHHAMAALEAVAKEWGGTKDNLGDIIKKRPEMFPPPLNEAAAKLWGFASNNARHGSENRKLELDEVFLLVGVCAALATYLTRKAEEAE